MTAVRPIVNLPLLPSLHMNFSFTVPHLIYYDMIYQAFGQDRRATAAKQDVQGLAQAGVVSQWQNRHRRVIVVARSQWLHGRVQRIGLIHCMICGISRKVT